MGRIVRDGGGVRGVVLEDGERIAAPVVLTAVDPRTALLALLDPPLGGAVGRDLASTHSGNAVQMLVHLAVDRLPAYPDAPRNHHGLQSFVDSLGGLVRGFAAAEAHRLPEDPVPTYAFTTLALDTTLAPPGHHTVYLACPCAPSVLDGGWEGAAEGFAERMVDTVGGPGAGVPLDRPGDGDPHAGADGRRAPLAGRAPDVPRHHAGPAGVDAPHQGALRPLRTGARTVPHRRRHRPGRWGGRHAGPGRRPPDLATHGSPIP